MTDALKNLTPQQLARLLQYAQGGEEQNNPDGATLHAEKNAPWVNGAYSHLRFPPYEFHPYPKMLFTADWVRCNEEYQNALRYRPRHRDEDIQSLVADAFAAREACTRTVQTPEDEAALGSEWAESPKLAVENRERLARQMAEAAAVSTYDDRRMGPLAQAEREAADAASEHHLVEVPRQPIRKKPEATV